MGVVFTVIPCTLACIRMSGFIGFNWGLYAWRRYADKAELSFDLNKSNLFLFGLGLREIKTTPSFFHYKIHTELLFITYKCNNIANTCLLYVCHIYDFNQFS